MNRQMVQIDCSNKPFAMLTVRGHEFIAKKVVASRGVLVTDYTVFGTDRLGQPQCCTGLLADAPDQLRKLINEAFSVAFNGEE